MIYIVNNRSIYHCRIPNFCWRLMSSRLLQPPPDQHVPPEQAHSRRLRLHSSGVQVVTLGGRICLLGIVVYLSFELMLSFFRVVCFGDLELLQKSY